MRISAELSAPVVTGARTGPSNAGDEAAGDFDQVLRHGGKQQRAVKASGNGRFPTQSEPDRPHWPGFAAALTQKAADAKAVAGKTRDGDDGKQPAAEPAIDDNEAKNTDNPQPQIPDKVQWLALHGSLRDPVSARSETAGMPATSAGVPMERKNEAAAALSGANPPNPDQPKSADVPWPPGPAAIAETLPTSGKVEGRQAIPAPVPIAKETMVANPQVAALQPAKADAVPQQQKAKEAPSGKAATPTANGRAETIPTANGRPEATPNANGRPEATPIANGRAGTTPVVNGRAEAVSVTNVRAETAPTSNGGDTVKAPVAENRAGAAHSARSHAEAAPAGDERAGSAPPADSHAGTTPVTVTAVQSFPAPASYPASQTIIALAGVIAADGMAKSALSAPAGQTKPAYPVAAASHMLKIELHPAELGTVTANLRLAGGQLSIELRPETQEAHRRLSSDSDTLVKSLQGLGLNVDKLTIMQPSIAANAAPRPDAAGANTNAAGRDPSSFQSGGSGGNGDTSGGQHYGRNRGNDAPQGGQGGTHPRERAGGSLFI